MGILNYVGANFSPNGTAYMEYGSGTLGNLPFRVDSNGNVTAVSVNAQTAVTPGMTAEQINAVITSLSAFGGLIAIQPGDYITDEPIVLLKGTRLTGYVWNNNDTQNIGATFSPSATWAQGGASRKAMFVVDNDDCCIEKLNINMEYPIDTIDGIKGSGNSVTLRDVCVFNGPENGVSCLGRTWRVYNCLFANAYNNDVNELGTDSDWFEVYASSAGNWGIQSTNSINSKLINPRCEFNTAGGLQINGDNTATGGVSVHGFTSDGNMGPAVQVYTTGYWPVQLNGLFLRRDGRNGTSAALNIAAGCLSPVTVNGCMIFPGFNDDGSGIDSPVTGVNIGAGCRYISLNDFMVHAVTSGFTGSAPQNGRALAYCTGSWFAPGAITLIADTS